MIVAIAGNAVENVAGITLAAKGKMDDAISVVKNSVAQIAAFLFPALVLISLLFTSHLTFVLDPVYIGALLLTALVGLAGHRRRRGDDPRGRRAHRHLRDPRLPDLLRVSSVRRASRGPARCACMRSR